MKNLWIIRNFRWFPVKRGRYFPQTWHDQNGLWPGSTARLWWSTSCLRFWCLRYPFFMGKSSIDNGFSIAMLDSQRVHGSYGLQNMSPVTIVETNVCFSRDFSCWKLKAQPRSGEGESRKRSLRNSSAPGGGGLRLPRCRVAALPRRRFPFLFEAAEYYFERACAPQESWEDKKT